MIKGLSSKFIENFQVEEEEYEDEDEDVYDEIDEENENENNQEIAAVSNNSYDNNPTIKIEDNVTVEEEEEGFNNQTIEPFSSGKKIIYGKHKLLLKSILFGILFYLLSSKQAYQLTKPYLKKLDGVIIHSILFVVLHYFLNIVF